MLETIGIDRLSVPAIISVSRRGGDSIAIEQHETSFLPPALITSGGATFLRLKDWTHKEHGREALGVQRRLPWQWIPIQSH